MRIAIRQHFINGPFDGRVRTKALAPIDIATEAADVSLACSFDEAGIPRWSAWYASDDNHPLVRNGEIELIFQDYLPASKIEREVYRKHLEAKTHGD